MKNSLYSVGVIGKSGAWYSCDQAQHIEVMQENISDAPFVKVNANGMVYFDAFYSWSREIPTREQFETLMDWCTVQGVSFEEATDCWSDPWESFRG